MGLGDLVAAAEPLLVDGEEYRLAPLGIREFGEFERWVEMLPMENLKPLLEGLTDSERLALLKDARAECKLGSGALVGDAGQAMMNTVRGAGYMFWLSLRKHQPLITRDKAESLITMANLMDMRTKLLRISGITSEDENPPSPAAIAAG